MKPLISFIPGLLLTLIPAIQPGIHAQQSLSGNYTLQSGEVILSLSLSQQGSVLQGTLSGSAGASFQLAGEAEDGVGYGTCSGAEGTVYFEVYVEGTDLTLSLIEPDQFGAPDYNRARYLQFRKTGAEQTGTTPGSVTGALGLEEGENRQSQGYAGQGSSEQSGSRQGYSDRAGTGQNQGNQGQGGTGYNQGTSGQGGTGQSHAFDGTGGGSMGSSGSSRVGENEVGDPSWGIKFGLPSGWVKRLSQQGAIVGHNTIPGMVLVMPHMSQNLQEMQAEMQQGLQEEGSTLMLSGGLEQLSSNLLAGNFTGIADGTQVKARGFGILSPYGGGAYLIAVSTPDNLGSELLGAAESMIKSTQYFKVEVGDLMQHFAGTWSSFGTNTSTWITFYPDGTYSDQSESSYSGEFNDGAGNQTGNWNAMGQSGDKGRWTVRGNKDSGTIIVKLNNGEEYYYEYRVHIEKGNKYYNEYYFNGDYYMRNK